MLKPLMNACALERQPEPRKKLVALLLAHNADTCRSDKEGYSCLHWASACGAKDCIAALLEAGAMYPCTAPASSSARSTCSTACWWDASKACPRTDAAGGTGTRAVAPPAF